MNSLAWMVGWAVAQAVEPPVGGWPDPPEVSTVTSVYDGDTFTLATGDKVRLRWVNTPELRPSEQYAIEARNATEQFVLEQEIRLLTSTEQPRDSYGRIVAGTTTSEGDLSIRLLEMGLGHVFIIPPDDTDLTAMLEAQERARNAGRGIWSTERYRGALHITSFHANAAGDDREHVNGEYLRVCNVQRHPLNLDGYQVTRATGRSWTLPALTIPAGHTVEIHSGIGNHQLNPSRQLLIYLGNTVPIWNNKKDRVVIYDRFGQVVDARDHLVMSTSTR